MIEAIVATPSGVAATEARSGADRLKEASEQLEGVFVQQLMKALRDTVPEGGTPNAPGGDLYSSLLDEHLAQVIADDTKTGIAEALYRQLSAGVRDPSPQGVEIDANRS